ncbi:MAG: PilZ domain-containing protein, partial [Spirochaetales bacterium]|nr:PilZ domain-containing protein [Spirochaetales bacterium]
MLPLLQRMPFQIFEKPDASQNIVLYIVIGVVLAGVGLWAFLHKPPSMKPGHYSRRLLHKRARRLKLSKVQVHFLETIIRQIKFVDPLRALENNTALDRLLRQAMHYLQQKDELSESDKEVYKSMIYDLKQHIEANLDASKVIATTSLLPLHAHMTIRSLLGSFPTQIISNIPEGLGLLCPHSSDPEKRHPWPKGEELSLMFVRDDGAIFSYKTHVLSYKTIGGNIAVFTEHVKNLKQVQKRHTKRRDIGKPAVCYLVNIVESKVRRKVTRQAVVNTAQKHLGTLQDISAGGCSMQLHSPLPAGSLVKLDFETSHGQPVSVYGKVKGITAVSKRGIVHIQFTSVSRHNLNEIREYVYEYANPDKRFSAMDDADSDSEFSHPQAARNFGHGGASGL